MTLVGPGLGGMLLDWLAWDDVIAGVQARFWAGLLSETIAVPGDTP